ncbi:hypothetical protein E3A20_13350 [Planctomyces bekefii]|uniref:Uncharacterized protein n=1 Tax=Planctomyces bekefii TaxID=1653850 RepID=A0A5C6M4M0_9PLAN|nr:hypothetical protein E3A20_13350 [Planctomyces bekefii]
MSKKTTIKDLIPDDKNFNKGSEFGNALIEKSFRKFGAGRSILIDKNNRVIAGNKSLENFSSIGLEDVQIVESDGKKLIAVRRNDIDLDSPEGREMALADNASAKANIVFDAELIEAEVGEAVCVEWGIQKNNFSDINLDDFFEENNEDKKEQKNKIVLEYTDEEFELVTEALKNHSGSKEQIFFKLLAKSNNSHKLSSSHNRNQWQYSFIIGSTFLSISENNSVTPLLPISLNLN